MKYRLVQDHTTAFPKWFRVELFRDDRWALIESGGNLEHLRRRFDDLVAGKPEYTVIEEAESA